MSAAQIRAQRKRVNAQIAAMKQDVAKDIKRILERKCLSQAEASYLTGEAQSQMSLICNGKLRGFSFERLIRTRALLGSVVRIVTHNTPQNGGPDVRYSPNV